MNYTPIAIAFPFALLVCLVLTIELGRRIGARRIARYGESAVSGSGVIESAVFALLGLLLAFTFSGAAERFDVRRELVVQEANNIGTAYLRLDLLPASAQPPLREAFRNYLDTRISVYQKFADNGAFYEEMTRANALQQDIWTQAVAAAGASGTTTASMLLLPAINDMIDITTTRSVAAETHPPLAVFVMLLVLLLASSLLTGHSMAAQKQAAWLHMLCFAIVTSAAVYVVIDFEYPRVGLIRIDMFDHVLTDLRASMK